MANDFYQATGSPSTRSSGSSSTMRAEFAAIEDAFDKLPSLFGKSGYGVFVNSAGNGLETKSQEQMRSAQDLSLGLRNKIINGRFDLWDYATSQTSSGYGSTTRWQHQHAGSTKTTSRQAFTPGQTDVPSNPVYYCQTAVSSVAGVSNYVAQLHYIEGVRTLAGKEAMLSFYAKADASRSIAIEFRQSFGTGGAPSSYVTSIESQLIALTDTWKKFEIPVSIPSISGKTIGTNTDDSLQMIFWFDAGSTFSARTAGLGQQSGTFDISDVQLEETDVSQPVSTPIEERPLALETILCRRFYQPSLSMRFNGYVIGAAQSVEVMCELPTEMRAAPTLVHDTPNALINCAASNIVVSANSGKQIYASCGVWSAAGAGRFHVNNIHASAELT
jgi:hypothetical protein